MLKYVLYHANMTKYPNIAKTEWERLCRELSQHDVMVIDCETICGTENLQESLKNAGIPAKEALLLAMTQEEIDVCVNLPIAIIGVEPSGAHEPAEGVCQPEHTVSAALYGTQVVLLTLEDVDYEFVYRIWKRKHGLPWIMFETKRCYLREMTLDDMDDLFSLYEKEGMTDYIEPLYEREEEIEYQRAYIRNMYDYFGYGMWLVKEKGTDQLIGRAGIDNRIIDGQPELELGYMIDPAYQRKGYATEVCSAILDWVRRNLEFLQINCLIEEGNEASVHLVQNLGFEYDGQAEQDGKRYRRYIKYF